MQTPRGEIRDEILELLKHEDVLQQMSETKSSEECYEAAKPIIGDMGLNEFELSMTTAKAYLDDQESGVLTEEDLEMIAGGKTDSETTANILSGLGVAISAIGIAASL